jgi:hypothetical protein
VSISGCRNYKCSVFYPTLTSGESPCNCVWSIFLKIGSCLGGQREGCSGLVVFVQGHLVVGLTKSSSCWSKRTSHHCSSCCSSFCSDFTIVTVIMSCIWNFLCNYPNRSTYILFIHYITGVNYFVSCLFIDYNFSLCSVFL